MTTIAWDGELLAGDKRTTCGNMPRTTTKIHRLKGGIVGMAGSVALITEMLHWLKAGAKPSTFPDKQREEDEYVNVLIIKNDGTIIEYATSPYPIVIEEKHVAMGSGRDFAMAAMHLGCSAATAVEVASKFDVGTGNGVDVLELKPTKKARRK